MTKKRLTAVIICSPILLAMFLVALLVACVEYATSGKWELRNMLKSDFGITLKSRGV